MAQSTNFPDSAETGDARRLAELVRSARKGDNLAFNRLVDLHYRAVYKMVFYRVKNSMDAEDLTQDVFLQAYRCICRLRSASAFRSWLLRIAINRIKSYRRRKRWARLFGLFRPDDLKANNICLEMQEPQGVENVQRHQFWRLVDRLMEALSPAEQEVFRLRFFDQLSIGEIGQVLGKPESTIKTHLYRALRKVKSSPHLEQLAEVAP